MISKCQTNIFTPSQSLFKFSAEILSVQEPVKKHSRYRDALDTSGVVFVMNKPIEVIRVMTDIEAFFEVLWVDNRSRWSSLASNRTDI